MRTSFEAAFAAEFGPLYRFLRRRVGADGAEDLAAATFATAFANWERFDGVRPVRPWLYGIAANLMRHHWRDERRMLRAYARTGVDPVLSADDDVVEVPARVTRAGAEPLAQPPLAPELLGLTQHVAAYERLALRAALSREPLDVKKALLAHPLIGQYAIAEQLLESMVAEVLA